MDEPTRDPGILGLVISAAVAAGGAIWALGRRVFGSVTREELAERLHEMLDRQGELEAQRSIERNRLHQENLSKFSELFGQMRVLSERVSKIEGRCYPQDERRR